MVFHVFALVHTLSQAALTLLCLLYLANSHLFLKIQFRYHLLKVSQPKEGWWLAHLWCHWFKSIDLISGLPSRKSWLYHNPIHDFGRATYPLPTSVSSPKNVDNHSMYNLVLLKVYNEIMHIKLVIMYPVIGKSSLYIIVKLLLLWLIIHPFYPLSMSLFFTFLNKFFT